MTKTQPFDPARHLDNPEVIAGYLTEAFNTGDSKLMLRAIQTVARADKGRTAMARTRIAELEQICERAAAIVRGFEVAYRERRNLSDAVQIGVNYVSTL